MRFHDRFQRIASWIVLSIFAVSLSGCAIGNALYKKKNPGLKTLGVGQDRRSVRLNLGEPYRHMTLPDGSLDYYDIEDTEELTDSETVLRWGRDIYTLGVLSTYGALFEAEKGVVIEYDLKNKVRKVYTDSAPSIFNVDSNSTSK